MQLDRRAFLRRMAAATAAAVATASLDLDPSQVDVERILWTPGEKTIFIPPAQGWVAPKQPVVLATHDDMVDAIRNFERVRGKVKMPDGKFYEVASEASTAMGRAEFDAHGSLLRLGGRIVSSAEEQARYVASKYQGSWRDTSDYAQALYNSLRARTASGLVEPGPVRRTKQPATLAGDGDWLDGRWS